MPDKDPCGRTAVQLQSTVLCEMLSIITPIWRRSYESLPHHTQITLITKCQTIRSTKIRQPCVYRVFLRICTFKEALKSELPIASDSAFTGETATSPLTCVTSLNLPTMEQ